MSMWTSLCTFIEQCVRMEEVGRRYRRKDVASRSGIVEGGGGYYVGH